MRPHTTLPRMLTRMSLPGCDRQAVSRGRVLWMCLAACLASATVMYFADPDRGKRRRNMLRDRGLARFRRMGRGIARMWRGAAAETYGVSHRIVHLVPRATDVADDETLRQRIESQLFRDRHIPKGDLNITCEHGLVILRGQLDDPSDIARIEDRVRRMTDVRGIQNLLHPIGTPAPNKERSQMATAWDAAI